VSISGENIDADSNLEVEVAAEYVAEHLAAYAQIVRTRDNVPMHGLEDDGTMRVGFNARYMVEAVNGMGDSVTLQFAEPTDACRVDGENGRLAVTMPKRL
jgi:hypothetical protein